MTKYLCEVPMTVTAVANSRQYTLGAGDVVQKGTTPTTYKLVATAHRKLSNPGKNVLFRINDWDLKRLAKIGDDHG